VFSVPEVVVTGGDSRWCILVLVVRGLVVETAVTVAPVIVMQIRFTQLKETNEPWNNESQEAKQLLEGCQSENQRQKQQQLELEQLEDDQQRNEQLLQLSSS
jgi:FtsZ-binding cell division protein ZapB